jgi:hypothetical protein
MRAIADAVLYEGYLLYPYRASSDKNRLRWQFGVLAPRAWSEATGSRRGGCRASSSSRESSPRIHGCARFLQPEARRLEVRRADGSGFEPVDRLEIGGHAVPELRRGAAARGAVRDRAGRHDRGEASCGSTRARALRVEPLPTEPGIPAARFVRETAPTAGRVHWSFERSADPRPHWRLRVRCENDTPWTALDAPRDSALRSSFAGLHVLFEVENGAFVSLADPPDWARRARRLVRERGLLARARRARGRTGRSCLASPIILSDHPQVAPESRAICSTPPRSTRSSRCAR